jgi:cytosine/adenosine deaminase-related metal-dependent hydrolase
MAPQESDSSPPFATAGKLKRNPLAHPIRGEFAEKLFVTRGIEMAKQTIIHRARWIFPISRPPIRDGWVLTVGHQILEVSQGTSFPSGVEIRDHGDLAILPGLINAHTHLEFSNLRCPLGRPGIPLDEWIVAVIQNRLEHASSRSAAIRQGANEAHAGGARLICEIATPPWEVDDEPLAAEIVAYAEVLGLADSRADERIAAAEAHALTIAKRVSVTGGISPHAPYSTSLETIRRSVELACRNRIGVAMHLAESVAERELLELGTGQLSQRLQALGVYREQCFGRGPHALLDILKLLAPAPFALVVHGHDLRDDEIEFLVSHPRMSLIYCPRTQAFFGHEPGGLNRMLRLNGRIALGTDSRASNPDLSIWNEMRWLWAQRPDIDWQRVLQMGTIAGADAVLRTDLGRIESGAMSGLIGVSGNSDRPEQLISEWLEVETPQWLTAAI